MWLVLSVFGYESVTWKGAFNRLIMRHIMANQDGAFVPAFMWMYLLIPAMNVYLANASRRNLYATLGVLLGMFTLCGTFLFANVYHHVFWYCTLYFVGATIRKHPFDWMGSMRVCSCLLGLSIVASWASVVGIDYLAVWLGRPTIHPYFFVADSNKVLAFLVAFFAFLTFKNWQIPQSRFINAVAATTFGVLLIHAATDGMRKWLWQDFVNVPGAYGMSLPCLIGYSIVVMIGVFAICSAIDYLRIRFIERPVFRSLNH